MTKTETLLRALLGPVREDIRPLAETAPLAMLLSESGETA